MEDYNKAYKKLKGFDQDHLLQFWERLNVEERKSLLDQIDEIDVAHFKKSFDQCTQGSTGGKQYGLSDLEPVPQSVYGSVDSTTPELLKEYEEEGLKQICRGKVGVILLAGGQGTRLGVSYPKGMYNVGLPSGKTLFQLMAERLFTIQKLAEKACGKQCIVPWYIMTSGPTKKATVDFFEENDYFGLSRENVVFFSQGCLPCAQFNGKMMLESPGVIAQSPDGNGGLYSALYKGKIIDDLDKRSVEFLHVYCVDNILVKIADPVFIGFCILKKAHCGYKVVEKTDPNEPVGVICKHEGKYHVAEYSEVTKEVAEKRSDDGKLTYNAGGIANHFFTVQFIKDVIAKEGDLIHHVAKKKIPYCDETGNLIKPTSPNGIKMEKFIFDVFQFTDDFAVWGVRREEEFSPLKNSDSAGCDCPSTSRSAIFKLHKSWIEQAGGIIALTNEGENAICEVSPLVSYGGEDLEKIVKGKSYKEPIHINA